MTTQIAFTPPIVDSKNDPEMARQLHTIHQLVFDRLQNHFQAIHAQQAKIAALDSEIKALKGAKK